MEKQEMVEIIRRREAKAWNRYLSAVDDHGRNSFEAEKANFRWFEMHLLVEELGIVAEI